MGGRLIHQCVKTPAHLSLALPCIHGIYCYCEILSVYFITVVTFSPFTLNLLL